MAMFQQGARAGPRHRREHELLPVSALRRTHRHLRPRGRARKPNGSASRSSARSRSMPRSARPSDDGRPSSRAGPMASKPRPLSRSHGMSPRRSPTGVPGPKPAPADPHCLNGNIHGVAHRYYGFGQRPVAGSRLRRRRGRSARRSACASRARAPRFRATRPARRRSSLARRTSKSSASTRSAIMRSRSLSTTGHDTGIYSWEYLRNLAKPAA